MYSKYPKLILPKPHLSWTQLSCWLSNEKRYRREYFENGKRLDTRFLTFGKNIATMIEEGRHHDLLPELEVYDTPEHKIECKVNNIVPCLSFLDSWDSKKNVFLEYKTGKHAWTKAKVQKHDQLLFYATMLKWSVGSIPEYCDLVWIETQEVQPPKVDFWQEDNKIIQVTGEIKSFHREFDDREIERMEELITKVAWGISDAYQDYLSEL